jgi:hypothetical protein
MLSIKRTTRITAGILAFTFLFSLAKPVAVYAQDEQPVDPTPTEEVQPAAETPVTEETPAAPLSDLLEQIPEDTSIVVISSEGEPLPLASEEALKTGVTGSTTWCPTGKLPGDASCTNKYFSLKDLLTNIGSVSGGGTVYLVSTYNAVVGDDYNQNIWFDQDTLTNLTNLTFQGGWNFGTNSLDATTPYSTVNLGTGSFIIQHWDSDVNINNIRFANTTGNTSSPSIGVVYGTGDVSLDNVQVITSGGHAEVSVANERPGFLISTAGDVSITDSQFNGNISDGLILESGGNVTLDGVSANSNQGTGAVVDTCKYDDVNGYCTASGSLTLNGDNHFNSNDSNGLYIDAGGQISQASDSTLEASANDNNGLEIWRDGTTSTQPISLLGSNQFNNNMSDGLLIWSSQDITINDLTANENGTTGASIHNLFEYDFDLEDYWGIYDAPAQGLGGSLTLTGTNTFNDNSGNGLEAFIDGTISASNLNASNNYVGVLFASCPGFYDYGDMFCYMLPDIEDPDYDLNDYDVTISGENNFIGNYEAGLAVNTLGNITLGTSDSDTVTAQSTYDGPGAFLQSGLYEAYFDEEYAEWDINWDDASWWDGGNITLNGTQLYGGYDFETANSLGNAGSGLAVQAWNDEDSDYGNVTMTNPIESSNNNQGISICASGTVDISGDAKVFTNNQEGIYIDCANDVTVENITANYNDYGLYLEYINGDATISENNLDENIYWGLTAFNFEQGSNLLISNVTMNENGQYGFDLYEIDQLDIENSEFNANGYGGMYGSYINDLTITDSSFDENGAFGDEDAGIFLADVQGDVSMTGVEAMYNNGQGLAMSEFHGDVELSDSNFGQNAKSGISLISTSSANPQITITNVLSDSNDDSGIYLDVTGDDGSQTTLNCSSFSGNGGYGVEMYNGVNATLAGVTATDNGIDLSLDHSGTLLTFTDCVIVEQKPANPQPGGSSHVVPVTSGQSVPVECGYVYTSLVLGTGDTAAFDGFCGSDAAFSQVESASLPGALTEGWTFISAFTETVDGSTDGILPDGGSAELNLAAGGNPASLAVLYWDAGAKAWVEIPVVGGEGSFSASNPAYKVLTGVTYTADGTARFSVNFTGTFVVVRK